MEKTYRSAFIEKFNSDGALYERDKLNIILSNAYNGKDMSEITDKLLSRFPSVKAVICASLEEITAVGGVSERVALYLKTLGEVAERTADNSIKEIKNTQDFCKQITERFACRDNEFAEFYLVNSRGKVLDSKSYTSGNADMVEMHTDEFVVFLSNHKPYGLYCVHNHVNCPCNPSHADDNLTRKIASICATFKVKFFDHCIINSEGEIFSYHQSGRLAAIT